MKRINGILGASLAGFAALTIAAITGMSTEARAFKAPTVQVRVAAPTHMTSVSNSLTTSVRTVSQGYELPGAIMSFNLPVGERQPSPSHDRVPISVNETTPVPDSVSSISGAYRLPGALGVMADPSRIQVPNTSMAPEFDSPVSAIKPNAKIKRPVTLEPPRGFLDEVFGGGRMEEIFIAAPELDINGPGRPDGPDRNDGRHDGNSDSIIPVDDGGSSTPNSGSNADPAPCESCGGSPDDPNRGGDESSEGGDSLGHEADHTQNPGETDDGDDQGNSAAVDGADAGGSGTTDNGGKEDGGDDVGRNPDEGDDPDEIRNGLRARNLNVAGMQDEAAMGGKSRSGGESGSGIQLGKTDGTGWFRNHATQHNPNADPEAGGPAEMVTPIGTAGAGINLRRGQAMSPTVDDRQNGTGGSGPIGPVADEIQSATASFNMNSHLTAATSSSMASPTVEDKHSGNAPNGPGRPVAW